MDRNKFLEHRHKKLQKENQELKDYIKTLSDGYIEMGLENWRLRKDKKEQKK